MMKRVLMLAATLSLAAANNTFAATVTPDQVGDYVGTATYKLYSYSNGLPQVRKLPVLLSIHADDSYTLQLDGNNFSFGTGTFGPGVGFLHETDSTLALTIPVHFKKRSIKANLQFGLYSPNNYFSEAKIKARKVVP